MCFGGKDTNNLEPRALTLEPSLMTPQADDTPLHTNTHTSLGWLEACVGPIVSHEDRGAYMCGPRDEPCRLIRPRPCSSIPSWPELYVTCHGPMGHSWGTVRRPEHWGSMPWTADLMPIPPVAQPRWHNPPIPTCVILNKTPAIRGFHL